MMTNDHPWLPADAGDESDDVGDPRDMTVPVVRRGGMTVADESAWLAAINEYTKSESIAFLRAADQFAGGVEKHMRARPDLSFEVVCASIGEAPLAPDASALRDHWIYGPRFWAWWQGRQKPRVQHALAAPPGCDPGGPARNVPIRVGDYIRARDQSGRCDFDFWARVTGTSDAANEYVHCIGLDPTCEYHVPLSCVTDHRAAPRITLPDGREVVPERMWERRPEFGRYEVAQVGDGPCGYVERVDNSFPWGFDGAWAAGPDPAYYRRTWPPADVEGA